MKTTLQGLSAKITNLEKPPLHIPDGKGGTYKPFIDNLCIL